ncbi:hypothetical protein MP228_012247 [Amoeboaphelidium protococcarum]|nr:hypothetical protein MP228_012247 [Amoeboaphelidium protococcarum]
MVYEITRKCKLNTALNLDAFDKSALIAFVKTCSTSLSSAQRFLYICLNVWQEEGTQLPDLSHQQYVASMLEFLCNPQFPHDRQSFHTQLLGDAIGPAVLEQLHHASLAGPNPNLYEFGARRVMQAVRWHLTTTLFVYQKRILQAQLEPFGITGRKLTLYIALLNALKFDNPSEAFQFDHPELLLLDRSVKVSISAEYDADDQEHQEVADAELVSQIYDQMDWDEDLVWFTKVHRSFLLDIVTSSYEPPEPRREYVMQRRSPRNLEKKVGVHRQVRARSRQQLSMKSRAGPAFDSLMGQQSLVQYMGYLRDETKGLEVPSFSIFPMGTDVPRYVQVDRRVLHYSGIQSLSDCSVKSIINLKKTRLRKIAVDVDEVTLLSDGYGCSIAVKVKDRPWQYANVKSDLESNRQSDVSGKLFGAVYLTDAKKLAERMEGAQVFGVDPGKKNPMVWTKDRDPVLAANRSLAQQKYRRTGHITAGHWRKLTLEKQYEAAASRIKPVSINVYENDLAQVSSKRQYLNVLMANFPQVVDFYSSSFHRSWRFRRYCATQSGYDNVMNHMLHGRETPQAAVVHDHRRRKRARRRKKKQRKKHERMVDPAAPTKPPVIAYGNAGVMHVKKNPPVPVRGFAYHLSRRGLVVSIPEYQTTKLCSCCHHGLRLEKVGVYDCHHTKRRRRVPEKSHPVLCCFDASGSFLQVSSNCPDRQQKQVESRLSVCSNCQVLGQPYFVDRDVNASLNMLLIVVYFAETRRRPDWNRRAGRRT